MKKLIAMVMMVILVLGMTVTAQAELRFTHFGEYDDYVKNETHYYATIESDSGDSQQIELTREEWIDLQAKWAKIKAKENQAVRFANRNWYENIVPTITFWDLND